MGCKLFSYNKSLILGASGISFLGNGMHFIALSWLVLQTKNDPIYVSLLVLLGVIPGLLFSPIAGVVVDRYNKKFLLITTDLIRFLAVLSIPIIGKDNVPLWYLYLMVVLITISSNFFFPSISSVIKTSFSKDEYFKVISANGTLIQLGTICGAGLAGIIMASYSIDLVFYIDAATFLLSAILLSFLSLNKEKAEQKEINEIKERQSIFIEMKEGFKYVSGNKFLIFIFAIGIIPDSVSKIINSLLSSFTKETLNLGSQAYGILDASIAVGCVIIGIVLSTINKKVSEKILLLYGLFFMSISLLCLSLSHSFIVSILALMILGASVIVFSSSRKALLMKNVEDNFIGRVESLNWMLFSSISPLLALAITSSTSFVNIQGAFTIISTLLIILFFICLFILLEKKHSFQKNLS